MRYVGIDPSTKTGIVILDKHGELIDALEVTATGEDPGRMAEIIHETFANVEPNDIVAIEGFGYASQSGFLLGGIGWGIRIKLHEWGIDYIDVAPTALKKFTGAKGNAKKDELSVEIFKRWGFEHKSDNVRDAYVLAQIARAYHGLVDMTKFQREVIEALKNPSQKKTRRKRASA
jgi:crossover junction endodeoxyribonuclease RuvC